MYISLLSLYLFIYFQMLTNALQLRISVMPTLAVLTPMLHTTVLANQDIPEMDAIVKVRFLRVIACC